MINYFGTLFNNITIERVDGDGDKSHLFRVPLQFGPKDREIVRSEADPEIQREFAIILPRMSFQLNNVVYDSNRKLMSTKRFIRKSTTDPSNFKTQYNAVPYDFMFSLKIYSKSLEDSHKIVEQILPFFGPDWTATINLIPSMDIVMDIPVILQTIDHSDNYEGGFDERRLIEWTLNFVLKGYFFGPIVEKPIIKFATTELYAGNTSETNTKASSIIVSPGQDSNGAATTDANLSVNAFSIDVDSNWGYVVQQQGEAIIFSSEE